MKYFMLITILLVLLIGVGIGAYRSLQDLQNLPIKSMKNIQDTIDQRDAENFYRLVDIDKVLDDAAKEILSAKINAEFGATAYSMQELANIFEQRKPEFTSITKKAVDDYISTGKVNLSNTSSPTLKWLKDSEINSCVIKQISKPVIKENSATCKIEFYNQSLLFSFELEFALEKIDKNQWRIIGATGFENYLAGLNRALKKKLERLNAPVRNEIKDIFIIKGFSAKVVEGDEYGFSKTLKIDLKADVKPEKPLSKIVGRIIIVGRNGDEGITPFEIDMAYKPTGLQTFTINKTLNPFVQQDADAMKHGLRRNDLHIEITEIIYMDGTNLKQFEEIPE